MDHGPVENYPVLLLNLFLLFFLHVTCVSVSSALF